MSRGLQTRISDRYAPTHGIPHYKSRDGDAGVCGGIAKIARLSCDEAANVILAAPLRRAAFMIVIRRLGFDQMLAGYERAQPLSHPLTAAEMVEDR